MRLVAGFTILRPSFQAPCWRGRQGNRGKTRFVPPEAAPQRLSGAVAASAPPRTRAPGSSSRHRLLGDGPKTPGARCLRPPKPVQCQGWYVW